MAVFSKLFDASGNGVLQQPRTKKLLLLLLSGYAAYKLTAQKKQVSRCGSKCVVSLDLLAVCSLEKFV